MKVFWGDLHNHCAVSYGAGTPERALDNARQHLDFCSITGHAFWPDLPMDLERQNAIIGMHLGGFAKLRYFWKDLLRLLEEANEPGRFVTFPSYEWHSMEYGDYNCYTNTFDTELLDAPSPAELENIFRNHGGDFMLLPHHCAYVRGFRGTNWVEFDARRSPLVEIFSNHGCGESDDAPSEYHHSMGPRVGESMVRAGLLAGHRFGFYASTDSHDGYPGHYGHGVTGVFADRLEGPAIWNALWERRTVATTGARIFAEPRLGEATVGQVGDHAASLLLRLAVEGTAPIERVDLVEGARGKARIRRLVGTTVEPEFSPGRYKVKIECGWGRGNESSDWTLRARIEGGELLGFHPCFRFSEYRPGDTGATERVLHRGADFLEWTCRANANPAGLIGGTHFKAGGTQTMILDLAVTEGAELVVEANGLIIREPMAKLASRSLGRQIAGFGSPAIKINRAVPEREFKFSYEDPEYVPFGDREGFVYFRIVQADGQTAWTSPIWYE